MLNTLTIDTYFWVKQANLMRYTTKKKIWQDLLDANEENKSSKEQAICRNIWIIFLTLLLYYTVTLT